MFVVNSTEDLLRRGILFFLSVYFFFMLLVLSF
jgi:hypothetical protein